MLTCLPALPCSALSCPVLSRVCRYLRLIGGPLDERIVYESTTDALNMYLLTALGFNRGNLVILSVQARALLPSLHGLSSRLPQPTSQLTCHVLSCLVMSCLVLSCLVLCVASPRSTLKFEMKDRIVVEATADITVYDIVNKFRLVLFEVRHRSDTRRKETSRDATQLVCKREARRSQSLLVVRCVLAGQTGAAAPRRR